MKLPSLFLFGVISEASFTSLTSLANETPDNASKIPGYAMGSHKLAHSPVSLKDLGSLVPCGCGSGSH